MPRDLILIHGLWFPGRFLRVMAKGLEEAGFRVQLFEYASTRAPLERHARRLAEHLRATQSEGAHLLGHSLGGLLILQALNLADWTAPGRVVLLGSPLQGSSVARRAARWPLVPALLGRARQSLSAGFAQLPYQRECGMIAGSKAMGLGRITGTLDGPNDGTVLVAETRHPQLTDHQVLPVTHTGMLYSATVRHQASEFLLNGRFSGQ